MRPSVTRAQAPPSDVCGHGPPRSAGCQGQPADRRSRNRWTCWAATVGSPRDCRTGPRLQEWMRVRSVPDPRWAGSTESSRTRSGSGRRRRRSLDRRRRLGLARGRGRRGVGVASTAGVVSDSLGVGVGVGVAVSTAGVVSDSLGVGVGVGVAVPASGVTVQSSTHRVLKSAFEAPSDCHSNR